MKEIIRFTASWCQPCKGLAMNLASAELELPITVVDIDVNPELAIEYQVRSVPTMVLKENGVVKSKLVGLHAPAKIKEWASE